MDKLFIFTLFEDLDRQGPGSDACTIKMFDRLSPPEHARILDIGCGAGMQTLALARHCRQCQITALDIHQPFVDALIQKAEVQGCRGRITPVRASMDHLPFAQESFDLIWSEGSVFIMGFLQGITYWKQFLKSGGSLALSEMVWFTETPSDETAAFMKEAYPPMTTVPECIRIIRDTGYLIIDSFRLPDEAWWDEFYIPLGARITRIKDTYADNPDAMVIIETTEREIELFRKYSDQYGYQVFLLRKL